MEKIDNSEKKYFTNIDSAIHEVPGSTTGFYALESASGIDYGKWQSSDGKIEVGSLPDLEDLPNLSEKGEHHNDGTHWFPATFDQFIEIMRQES